jgi:hypothetical protein
MRPIAQRNCCGSVAGDSKATLFYPSAHARLAKTSPLLFEEGAGSGSAAIAEPRVSVFVSGKVRISSRAALHLAPLRRSTPDELTHTPSLLKRRGQRDEIARDLLRGSFSFDQLTTFFHLRLYLRHLKIDHLMVLEQLLQTLKGFGVVRRQNRRLHEQLCRFRMLFQG